MLVAGAVTMYDVAALRKSGSDQPFAQEILRVAGRKVLEGAENLVAALLVEAERLVAVGVQVGSETTTTDSIGLGSVQQT